MPTLFAFDPGPERTAVVGLDDNTRAVRHAAILPNGELRKWLAMEACCSDAFAIESVASYGMPVGAEVFATCVWIGRLIEMLRPFSIDGPRLITRGQVKLHLCGQTRGVNDSVLRQRLIDIYGPGKAVAIGTKKSPGPLYGLKADLWQALALAVTALETNQEATA
jgi:hypothetical protein